MGEEGQRGGARGGEGLGRHRLAGGGGVKRERPGRRQGAKKKPKNSKKCGVEGAKTEKSGKTKKPEQGNKERWAGKEAATKSRSRALQHTANSSKQKNADRQTEKRGSNGRREGRGGRGRGGKGGRGQGGRGQGPKKEGGRGGRQVRQNQGNPGGGMEKDTKHGCHEAFGLQGGGLGGGYLRRILNASRCSPWPGCA